MTREATFNFIPEKQLNQNVDTSYRVCINKASTLYFPKEVVDIYDLDKKFFKFYADTAKKAIAWSAVNHDSLDGLKTARKIGINQSGGGFISIQKMLTALGIGKPKKRIKDLVVKTYKGSYLQEEVQYITLNDENTKDEN